MFDIFLTFDLRCPTYYETIFFLLVVFFQPLLLKHTQGEGGGRAQIFFDAGSFVRPTRMDGRTDLFNDVGQTPGRTHVAFHP